MSLLRRAWLQIFGLALMLALVSAAAIAAFRPHGTTSAPTTSVARATPSSSPSPTPDPRIPAIEQAARRFIQAFWDSAKTGDANLPYSLAVPQSGGEAAAGAAAVFSREKHHNFMVVDIRYQVAPLVLSVIDGKAQVRAVYTLYGRDADWPSLRPREPDHETKTITELLEMYFMDGRWLVHDMGFQ